MMFRFTLSHDVLGSQVISEPDGWAGAKIKLERDPSFFSLIEYYEGAANGAFIFYGDNGTEDGGIDFIRQVETTYGFDAEIGILIEYSGDGVTYATLFSGQLDISQKNEMPDNKMQVPVIRDDFWSKFINRFETPVNLSDLTDLDGNAVNAVAPISVYMTSQVMRRTLDATSSGPGITDEDVNVIVSGTYYQVSFDQKERDELEDVFVLPQVTNSEEPEPLIELVYGGEYDFSIQIPAYDYAPGSGGYNFAPGEGLGDYLQFYLNINGTEHAFTLGDFFDSDNTDGGQIYTLTLNNQILPAGTHIKIYGKATASLTVGGGTYTGEIRWNGPLTGNISLSGGSSAITTIECTCTILGRTIRPPFEAQGYLIHDLIHGVLARIGLGTDPFYSEFLGSTFTNTKQYDDEGCGWMHAILKGLQIRQYTLAEKPFFISMKDIWEGINPILNLGLGYEQVEGSQVIRIEQKGHFIGDTAPVNFSNVRQISSAYDADYIFKTIKSGFKEWQSEDGSGLDDPQTKHTYATRFQKVGKDLDIESGFIAGSLAIEVTARTTKEKTDDYRHDNKNFIISLNTDDLSPDVYLPELDENFSSVTGINDPGARYNLILTPLRSVLRWGEFWAGCLQSYLSSSLKFVSGEGNYDMVSDAETDLVCSSRAVSILSVTESDDVSPSGFGYYFLPLLYDIRIPMEKDDFDLIDRKEPIGISQSSSGHVKFHIKLLEYDIVNGEAIIKAWPETFFTIGVPEQEITTPTCE